MKTWNMRKKKEAVSPVIATILMVAITVVLAAVLYVMVMGFGGDTTSAPSADLTKDGTRIVISINEATDYNELAFKVGATGTEVAFAQSAKFPATGTSNVTFVDVGADGKVSTGDYFQINGSYTGTLYVLWKDGTDRQNVADIAF